MLKLKLHPRKGNMVRLQTTINPRGKVVKKDIRWKIKCQLKAKGVKRVTVAKRVKLTVRTAKKPKKSQ